MSKAFLSNFVDHGNIKSSRLTFFNGLVSTHVADTSGSTLDFVADLITRYETGVIISLVPNWFDGSFAIDNRPKDTNQRQWDLHNLKNNNLFYGGINSGFERVTGLNNNTFVEGTVQVEGNGDVRPVDVFDMEGNKVGGTISDSNGNFRVNYLPQGQKLIVARDKRPVAAHFPDAVDLVLSQDMVN